MINILMKNNEINIEDFNDRYYKYHLIKIEDNDNLITCLDKFAASVVVLDFVSPCMNFILNIKLLKLSNPNIKVIVNINFIEESIIRLLYDNGVDYILIRPLENKLLYSFFDNVFKDKINDNVTCCINNDFEKKLIDTLNNLGMPANLKGYSYIKEALSLCLENKEYYLHTTSLLYPKLSKIFKSKETCIEKAIRGAIELCWIRGNVFEQEKIFGYTVNRNKGRPTNSEFLAQVYNYISVS